MNVAADLNAIPSFLDRRKIVYTYTMLSTYKNCGHQMFRRYVKKDIPYVETPEMKWGKDVHLAFEHRVGAGKPLPETMHQWEQFAKPYDGRQVFTEQKLGITREGRPTGFWDADCWFRGIVDLTLKSESKAFINDWKTGSAKFEDPFELEIGALLLKAKYPELTAVQGVYTWLKEHRVSKPYNLSEFRATWNEINRLVTKIEADRVLGEFEKKQSGLCKGWCSVVDCEHYEPPKQR
jgi:PD-(D/E)XK nuclease superfamily